MTSTANCRANRRDHEAKRLQISSNFQYVRPVLCLVIVPLLSFYMVMSHTENLLRYLTQISDPVFPLLLNTTASTHVHDHRSLSDIETTNSGKWNTIESSSHTNRDIPQQHDMKSYADQRLNVIILYPDDWRYNDIGDEHPVLKTPFFSQLAKDGIRFTHNAVTTAICWISRATLFTGQHVAQHASTYLFRPKFAAIASQWSHTWPFLLQQAGYYVGHVGKWQFRDQDGYRDRLFNYSIFYDSHHWYPWYNNTRIHGTDRCKYDALKFLREIKPNHTPFALTVAFYPPKGEIAPEYVVPETMEQYQHAFFPEPYNVTHAYEILPYFLQDNKTEARMRYLQRYDVGLSYQDGMKAYYAMISHIDAACQEIVEEIKRQGLYEKTMIIVTADHGEFHGSRALSDKWYPYQESIRTPLIIHDPRIPLHKRGRLNDAMTLNIDLAATILGAAGLPIDPVMQGRDVADLYLHDNDDDDDDDDNDNDDDVCSVASGPCGHHNHTNHLASTRKIVEPWRTEFFYEFPMINSLIPQSTAVVRKDWKYTYWKDYHYEQLFHIAYDPMEMNDLINHTEFIDIIQEMRTTHRKLQLEIYSPHIPLTRCDPIWPAGTDYSKLPRCHCLPNEPESICCCPFTPAELEQQQQKQQQ